MAAPTEINVHKKSATLELTFEEGDRLSLSAEFLRVFSPSAEVQGHGPGQAVLQTGKKNVQFLDIEPQGHYAIKIVFSDGHDSGIYSWDYLQKLGRDQETLWQQYLKDLEAAGKSRDPQFIALGN
jgi:DUF971 family protein